MSYDGKTNWQLNEIVYPEDMNRIEQGVKDVSIDLALAAFQINSNNLAAGDMLKYDGTKFVKAVLGSDYPSPTLVDTLNYNMNASNLTNDQMLKWGPHGLENAETDVDFPSITTVNAISAKLNDAALTSGDLLKWDGAKLVKATPGTDYATPLSCYPVGSVYTSINNVNPSTLFGGTWVSFASGRTLVGVDPAQTEFNTVQKPGGEKAHTLTKAEIPNYSIPINYSTQVGGGSDYIVLSGTGGTTGAVIPSAGGGQAHNNLQPYITVYFWLRTA